MKSKVTLPTVLAALLGLKPTVREDVFPVRFKDEVIILENTETATTELWTRTVDCHAKETIYIWLWTYQFGDHSGGNYYYRKLVLPKPGYEHDHYKYNEEGYLRWSESEELEGTAHEQY